MKYNCKHKFIPTVFESLQDKKDWITGLSKKKKNVKK